MSNWEGIENRTRAERAFQKEVNLEYREAKIP